MLGSSPLLENAMPSQPSQQPSGNDPGREEPADGRASAVPDEDGPHDVPDDQVIEKTLPAAGSVKDSGRAR
jgi:hypothetical protein